jgi:uncharacterized RDD family membrane protein YckC
LGHGKALDDAFMEIQPPGIVCPFCHAPLSAGARNCNWCGQELALQARPLRYAGFWRRVAATLIDIVLLFPSFIIAKDYLIVPPSPDMQRSWFRLAEGGLTHAEYQEIQLLFLTFAVKLLLVFYFVGAPYYVITESSELQGTLGKRLMGLRVTDRQGKKIGMGRAILRYLARPQSSLPSQLGFVLAAVPPKKKALHDYIVGTEVRMAEKD